MMKTKQNHQYASKAGFTLIEIVLATAIIAILAGLSFSGIRYYDEKMKYSRTEVLIASIESALEEYKADNGFYPQNVRDNDGNLLSTFTEQVYVALYGDGKLTKDSTDGLVRITTAPNGKNTDVNDGTTYLATLNPAFTGKQSNVENSSPYYIVDAWGRNLVYRHNLDPLPNGTPRMANPKQDYDLISLGPNGNGDFLSTSEAAKADDIKNW